MILLSATFGMFGCSKASHQTISDIQAISVSCGHMDNSLSYSFFLQKNDDGWYLSADYATSSEGPRIEYDEHMVSDEDVKELLSIIDEQDVIKQLKRYKKPLLSAYASDGTMYYSTIRFSNGELIEAQTDIGTEAISYFYQLAEKSQSN